MIFSLKVALLALASVAAAQSSTSEASASGSSSTTAAHASSSSSTNATSSGSIPLPSGAPPGLTPCILNCVTTAAQQNGCSSFADLSCVCTSKAFQTAAASCLMANCTPAEVTTANNLQTTECAAIVGSSGASSMAPNTRSNTRSSTASSGTPTAPAPTGGASSGGASSGAPAATTTNGAQISAASGIWALVAGLMGITAAAL